MSDNQYSKEELPSESDYDKLRALIVGHEAALVEELQHRLDNKQLRTDDLAEVLEAALRQSHANGANLAQAIEEPVQVCLKKSIERDTQVFADALFPVMGPAIRKAISESLKGLVQSINTTVENSVSAKGIKWRIEALRTGVSFGEIVLQNTLVYRVEQVLLVQRDSGLLMQHVAREDIVQQDGDAVSAMLTAIQDFVRDSFTNSEQEAQSDLASVELGDKTVWLFGHANTTMACVIRGIAPPSLREELQQVFESLLSNFSRQLDEFDGNRETLEIVTPVLQSCFDFEQRQDDIVEEDDKPSILSRIIKAPAFYIFLALFIWFSWFALEEGKQRGYKNDLVTALNQESGVVVIDYSWERPLWYLPKRHLVLSAFKDPSVRVTSEHIEELGWKIAGDEQDLFFKWIPYYSLDDDIIISKIIQRFGLPSETRISLDNGIAAIQGELSEHNADKLNAYAGYIEGVSRFDLDKATIIYDIDHEKIASLIDQVASRSVLFTVKLTPSSTFDATIDTLSQELKALTDLLRNSNVRYQVTLIGRADLAGGEALNLKVRNQRAEMVKQALLEKGVELPIFLQNEADNDAPLLDPSYRRVDIHVSLASEGS